MLKAILFVVVGAGAMYLYLNPGDVDGMVKTGRDAVHAGTSYIADKTAPTALERAEDALKGN